MAAPRTYHHLGRFPLWDWYSIRIEDDLDELGQGSKHVVFCSTIHMHPEHRVTFCWDAQQFTDEEILHDAQLYTYLSGRYGSDLTRS